MILLEFNRPDFEYDVQSLVKSFYPYMDIGFTPKDEILFTIIIDYLEDCINIKFCKETIFNQDSVTVDYGDRKDTKNKLKRLLYVMLNRETGIDLPWGTLTGIRPIKITVELFEKGYGEVYIRKYLKETYFLSEEKTDLSIAVAKRELELLKGIDYNEGYSLYIGIPFCPSTCSYCSFTSYSIIKYQDIVKDYLEALSKEIDFASNAFKGKKLNSIYIGGGTPTSLSDRQLDELLTKIKTVFDLTYCQEFTVEAGRPDSITLEKLNVIKKHNVGRISINPQTMKPKTLEIIGRRHTVNQVFEAFNLARECGFSNINMDFIIGLPDEDYKDIQNTMEQILNIRPDCITIHSLAIKRAAILNTDKDNYKDYKSINNDKIMGLTVDYAKRMGLEPYYLYRQKNMAGNMENVGYAAQGKASLYNILIMEEKQSIIALGAGAVTKIVFPDGRIERISNVKNVEQYISRINEMIERKNVIDLGE